MTGLATVDAIAPQAWQPREAAARVGRPARAAGLDWPATRAGREQVWQQLTQAPFVSDKPNSRYVRGIGLTALLDWLADQPGQTWQERWNSTGAEAAGRAWRDLPTGWLRDRGQATWRQSALSGALITAVCADIIRPGLGWLMRNTFHLRHLVGDLAVSRDPEGFTRLRSICDGEQGVSAQATSRTLYRGALIIAAKGGRLNEITPGDVLELLGVESAAHGRSAGDTALFYRALHTIGSLGERAPATLRELRSAGQRTPDELIDRYALACRPVRDLLVDYLRERQPALDYTSLESLAHFLGKLFWADLERHHPGIDSLHLPQEIATGWKQRLRTMTKTVTSADGRDTSTVSIDRINYRECLTPVRALYLDLAHWAVEDPSRWAPWVVPCPIGAEEINRRKAKRHRKARMDARTRERLPVLPVLVSSVDERRRATAELLAAARQTAPGNAFTAAGQTLTRSTVPHAGPGKTWADDPKTGKRRDLGREEDHAFWAWAAVEVLRATGVRVEELVELSHHSLVQYRLPTTGELVPLLQIAPSKTDAERLLVVSPELADVLSAIITRIRDRGGAVPLVHTYDPRERVWSKPAPRLFQRRYSAENRPIPAEGIRTLLAAALAHTGLTDPVTGAQMRFTPHDFRRMFITDAILNGLPPHIAQVIAGHQDINVTLGYKAVYPDEAIQAHLAFLARRRSLRPSEEYRVPTDEEWEEFLGHFQRRKVSIGTCGRPFATPCIHEHACVRCPMLWPDPEQHTRLIQIRDNLTARISEAEREGWIGEVEGLQVSLAGTEQKLAQLDRRRPAANPSVVDLHIPTARNQQHNAPPQASRNTTTKT